MTLEQLQNEIESAEIISEGSSVPFGNSFDPFFKDSTKAIKQLLPRPAAVSRAQAIIPTFPIKPILTIGDIYVKNDELYRRLNISWGTIGIANDITSKQLEEFANDYLLTFVKDQKELKYIDIANANKDLIDYRFAADRWLSDNFDNVIPVSRMTTSLEFQLKIEIPQFFKNNIGFVEPFITKKFQQYIEIHRNKLKNNSFSFLKKIDYTMFDYSFSYHIGMRGGFTAKIRSNVVLGALALYTAYKFHKKISSQQEQSIKASASRYSDIDKLDSFLKRLR